MAQVTSHLGFAPLGRLLWGSDSVFLRPRSRRLTICVAAMAGALGSQAIGAISRDTVVAILALMLAVPVAVSKTATACGVNVLGSFSDYRVPVQRRVAEAGLYVAVSGLTAGLIGGILSGIGGWLGIAPMLPLLAPALLYLGARELGYFPTHPLLTSRWQVPAKWVRTGPARSLTWGVFLGSGIATWMPSPSFYGLVLLATFLPWPAGVFLMGTYGIARGVPGLAASVMRRCSMEVMSGRMLELRLLGHLVNGFGCVAVAAALGVRLADEGAGWFVPALDTFDYLGALALSISVVLLISAAAKFRNLGYFRLVLLTTYRVPDRLGSTFGHAVPLAEVLCALLLTVPAVRVVGFAAATALIATFVGASIIALIGGGAGDCGCVGDVKPEPLGVRTVVRGGALTTLSLAGLALSIGSTTLDRSDAAVAIGLAGSIPAVLLALSLTVTAARAFRPNRG